MVVTLKECRKAGTVIHDKSATLCALRGDGAVSQEELGNGNRAVAGTDARSCPLSIEAPGLLGSVELCLASQT